MFTKKFRKLSKGFHEAKRVFQKAFEMTWNIKQGGIVGEEVGY